MGLNGCSSILSEVSLEIIITFFAFCPIFVLLFFWFALFFRLLVSGLVDCSVLFVVCKRTEQRDRIADSIAQDNRFSIPDAIQVLFQRFQPLLLNSIVPPVCCVCVELSFHPSNWTVVATVVKTLLKP